MISFFFNSKNENKRLDLRDHLNLTSTIIHFQSMILFGTVVMLHSTEKNSFNLVVLFVCLFLFFQDFVTFVCFVFLLKSNCCLVGYLNKYPITKYYKTDS